MSIHSLVFDEVLEAFGEALPIWAETVNEEPIPTRIFIKRVTDRVCGSSDSENLSVIVQELVNALLRFFQYLGLLNREALARNQVGGLTFDAYNAILSSLDLVRTESSGFWFAKEGDKGPSSLREFLKDVENNRLRRRLRSQIRPVRRAQFAVGIICGWCEELGSRVALLHKRERSVLGYDPTYRWELPGGMLTYSDIHERCSLRKKRELLWQPSLELVELCLSNHLYGKLGLAPDDYEVFPACDGKPIRRVEESETYVVLTEYVFHPFVVLLNQLPGLENARRSDVAWFPLDCIMGASHWLDGTVLKASSREIVQTAVACIDDHEPVTNAAHSNTIRVPVRLVRGIETGKSSPAATKTLYFDILGRKIELAVGSSRDLVVFENDSPPESVSEEKLIDELLDKYKHKYDILAYDKGGIVASRRSNVNGKRVPMRTGNSELFYTLQLLLMQVGRSVSYNDLIRVVYGLKSPAKPIRADEVSRGVGKLLCVLRKKLRGVLGREDIESFLDTESRTRTVIVGKQLSTCLIVDQEMLKTMAPLAREQ